MTHKNHCPQCNSQRKGKQCWKCGSETILPDGQWIYPKLPSIKKIRKLAKEVGYAIGVHGSLERDLDLIAAPWTDEAVDNVVLIEHIAKGINARIVTTEEKPLGRYASTLQINGYYKPIDISVCPIMG